MEENMKNCPFCGEEIAVTAKKCKHCGEFLEQNENKSNPINYRDNLFLDLFYSDKFFLIRKFALTIFSLVIIAINLIDFSIRYCSLITDDSAVRQTVYSVLMVCDVCWIILAVLILLIIELQVKRFKQNKEEN